VTVVLAFVAIAGAILTAFVLAPHGWPVAFVAAPFGGSLAAAVVAVLMHFRRRKIPVTGITIGLCLLTLTACGTREPFYTGFEQRMPCYWGKGC
jgi:hypothetical protein